MHIIIQPIYIGLEYIYNNIYYVAVYYTIYLIYSVSGVAERIHTQHDIWYMYVSTLSTFVIYLALAPRYIYTVYGLSNCACQP